MEYSRSEDQYSVLIRNNATHMSHSRELDSEGNFHVYLQWKIYIVKFSQTKSWNRVRILCCQKTWTNCQCWPFSEVFMLPKTFLLPKSWTNIQCWPVFRGPVKCIRPDSPWPTCQPSPRVHKFHKSKYQCCRKFRKIIFSRENQFILHRREVIG